jgi:hypothetical protein
MPSDHPEPLDLPAAKSSGKMQRLLRSAFKRGDSPLAAGSGDDADWLNRPGSGSSSSVASSGRPPSWRRARRHGGDGSADGDRSSHDSFELDGETGLLYLFALFPCMLRCLLLNFSARQIFDKSFRDFR